MSRVPDPSLCTRRAVLRGGLGSIALASLLSRRAEADARVVGPHFQTRAKNIIFLHMVGGPSQIDLLDPKPLLARYEGKPAPKKALAGKQFAFIGPNATLMSSPYRFGKHGRAGLDVSELLPHLAGIADRITVVRSMQTNEFNHGTAELFMMTGSPRFGRPSFGSWVSYGLGSENEDLPSFVVLVNGPAPVSGTPLWGAGFLPTRHQGVQFRSKGDPVLFLGDPTGMKREIRHEVVSSIAHLNRRQFAAAQDPEILTRVAQYELAFRMQASVPDLMAIDQERPEVLARYGAEPGKESFANSCLLARRMVERGVRFVQVYHANWDHHDSIFESLPRKCKEVDQPAAALIEDLEQRGLLDSTIVVWTGEFGRTPLVQAVSASGARTKPGRDHHRDAFSLWVAGGGFKAGHILGETDELGFSVVRDPVHVHDLQATLLHLLGLDHERLTYRYQGRDFRLTDVHGRVVGEVLAGAHFRPERKQQG